MPFNGVTFFFLISYTLNAFIDVSEIPFSREKLPKNASKNGDARSGLWAPACTRLISLSLQGFQVIQYKK